MCVSWLRAEREGAFRDALFRLFPSNVLMCVLADEAMALPASRLRRHSATGIPSGLPFVMNRLVKANITLALGIAAAMAYANGIAFLSAFRAKGTKALRPKSLRGGMPSPRQRIPPMQRWDTSKLQVPLCWSSPQIRQLQAGLNAAPTEREPDSRATAVDPAQEGSLNKLDEDESGAADVALPSQLGANVAQRLPEPQPMDEAVVATADGYDRLSQALRRLTDAETSLRLWSYVVEVAYTWLGLFSLGLACASYWSRGRSVTLSMGIGLVSVLSSCVCSALGWWQARGCRALSRRCGLAASSLEPDLAGPPSAQLIAVVPPLSIVERRLQRRERTAWIGTVFAVVGMDVMVGVFITGLLGPAGAAVGQSVSGQTIDVLTLFAATNCALMHTFGAGVASTQKKLLPKPQTPDGGWVRGWDY